MLGGCGQPGVARAPSWLLTSVLRAFPPAQPSRRPLLSGGLCALQIGWRTPRSALEAPAGPFGKRISFFLDAFPDLGVMEGLRAARAGARLREEEPDG